MSFVRGRCEWYCHSAQVNSSASTPSKALWPGLASTGQYRLSRVTGMKFKAHGMLMVSKPKHEPSHNAAANCGR
ncbi:hypothetical protein D3C76_1235040 [compost metagenome]